jgi:hypothetical protein
MPGAAAALNIQPKTASANQGAIAGQFKGQQLQDRFAASAAPANDNTTATAANDNAPAGATAQGDYAPSLDEEEEQDAAMQMTQQRQQQRNAAAQAQTQAKAAQVGQAVTGLFGKSPWGRAFLIGIKYIIKIASVFGPAFVGFLVTTWVIAIPLNILFIWLPFIGPILAEFFAIIFAIPLSTYIYPKLKPYIDEITKQTTLLPKTPAK